MALLLAACGTEAPQKEPIPSVQVSPPPEMTAPVLEDRDYSGLRLDEVMAKNSATLADENGEYHDWAELFNASDAPIELQGCQLAAGDGSWSLPAETLASGERLILFFGGEGTLHAPFSLSKSETLRLMSPSGKQIASCSCAESERDRSLVLSADGSAWESARYPTPGYPNDSEGYDLWQENQTVPDGLYISEVVADGSDYFDEPDWIELVNASDETISLSGCALSDDARNLAAFPLSGELRPGAYLVVPCGDGAEGSAPFALNALSDRIYLSRGGTILDAAVLNGLPAGGSFGRTEGRSGWFYYPGSSPGVPNGEGWRRVSAAPETKGGLNILFGEDAVEIELSAPGTIRCRIDGTKHGVEEVYTGAFTVGQSCIVRAVAEEPDAMPSRETVLTCLVGEKLYLPVASLVFDERADGAMLLNSTHKLAKEKTATLSFAEEDGQFGVRCGVNLSGNFSLTLPQKSLKIHFRSRYGDSKLHYDLFGDGVNEYSSLTLRKGQDSTLMVFRSEMWEDLCRSVSDRVLTQKSRFCILFIDGEYYGICSLREDFSRNYYALRIGGDKSAVEWEKLPFDRDGRLVREVFSLCESVDGQLSDEQYKQLDAVLDIDSVIDWMIVQGVSGNTDFFSNVAFFRSDKGDGKWRIALFDMDHAFEIPFYGLFGMSDYPSHYVTYLCKTLCSNDNFVRRLLARYAELWRGELSAEAVSERIDAYEALLAPEIERDFRRWGYSSGMTRWQHYLGRARQQLASGDFETRALRNLFAASRIPEEYMEQYFGIS